MEHCSSGAFFSPLRSSGAFLDTQVSLEPTPVSRLGSQLVGWSATLFHSVCLSGLVGQKTAQTCLIRSVPDLCVFKRCAFFFSVLNIVERGRWWSIFPHHIVAVKHFSSVCLTLLNFSSSGGAFFSPPPIKVLLPAGKEPTLTQVTHSRSSQSLSALEVVF